MAALSLTPGDILTENGLMEEPNCLLWGGREKALLQRIQRCRRENGGGQRGFSGERLKSRKLKVEG
jgi:hypothetical protein